MQDTFLFLTQKKKNPENNKYVVLRVLVKGDSKPNNFIKFHVAYKVYQFRENYFSYLLLFIIL